ncbi:MAG: HEAT repeat domain-containing protein [Myxococcales bacterium]|nr:HEAT repeat domain-containing protein [Myxococcales bacterium]
MRRLTYLLAAALAAAAAPALAQPADVPTLIQLIDKQPAGVDRPTWKEQRRDAARKLAASGDKRAVPTLIKLADAEAFDVIGEIAIEGLGALGDKSAVPTLEKIAADSSRDRQQRDLAKKALAKLGAPATPPPPPPPPPDDRPPPPPPPDRDVPPPDDGAGTGAAIAPPDGVPDLLGTRTPAPPATDRFAPDVLAQSEQLTFAVGAASLGYDSVRDRTAFDLDASGRYARWIDRDKTAWGAEAGARVVGGYLNPEGPARSRAVIVDVDAGGQFRAYAGPGVYGIGRAVIAGQLQYLSVIRDDPMDTYKEGRTAADLGVAIGGGYGRVIDRGPRLRVRQLEALLEAGRALGRPIDDDLAAKLQSAWWDTRRDRTGFRQLAATVAILREAGVLLGEPDAATTFGLIEVLRDPSYDHRPDGIDVSLQIGEEYLLREDEPAVPEGRTELVLVTATAARQLGLASEAIAHVDARYRILADDGVPAPWRVGADATWRHFVHAAHGELVGAFDVGARLAASDDDRDDTDLGVAIGGTAGWTWVFNRASSVRAAADVTLDAGELFLGARITGSYGFLDAGFARR